MERGIYATAAGMVTAQQWMDVVANNLANASVKGFKRDELSFDEALLRKMGSGGQSIGELGGGPVVTRIVTDFSAGQLESTGNPLDAAILGGASMFAVRTQNGIRYTRDGSFTIGEDRTLMTKDGFPVLDAQNRPIQLPEGKISIDEKGEISVDEQSVATLGLFDSPAPGGESGFLKAGSTLFIATRPTQSASAMVRQGALENSNVDPVSGMVQMISLSRAFEMAQRSITSQDELTQRLIQSLQDR